MKTTTFDQLVDHLELLGISDGSNVVVHSKLISFGKIIGGVEPVFKALQKVIGPTGTLVFPTYTLNLNSDDIYNPNTTPSNGVGSLSEFVRFVPGVIRSNCPMHGHCALGPLAKQVVLSNPNISLGPESSFAKMHELEFSLLLLGCDFTEGATFVHHVESEVGVPYRAWMHLSRVVKISDEKKVRMKCKYYGHKNPDLYENNFVEIQKNLEANISTKIVNNHFGRSFFIPLKSLYSNVAEILKKNPYVLINKKKIN